jgi:ferric iron reductase protein FhuF
VTPDEVCDAIDRLAVGGYAAFGGRLVGQRDQRRSVGADELLDTAMCKAIEDRFARRFDAFDPRAVHSIWMKWYLNAFIPPVLLADVLLGQSVGVDLAATRFILAEDGRIDAIRISATTDTWRLADPFRRLKPLVFDHFAPLIDMWCARTEVTRRVFWSNVGNTFEAMLRRIEAVSGPSERLAQAQRIADEPDWLGEPNPLFDAVHYVSEQDGAAVRRRRVCCLQYLLPDRRFCKACPIEEARAPSRQERTIP